MRLVAVVLALCCVQTGCGRDDVENRRIATGLGECDGCAIQLDDIWTSDANDPNVLSAGFYLQRGDELWAMGALAQESVTRYDIGARTSRLFRRPGEGPGEFSDQIMGAALDPSGDTLVIAQADRIEYLTGDLEPVRSFRPDILVRGALTVLDDGTVVTTNSRAPGLAVHGFNADGNHIGSVRQVDDSFRGEWLPLSRGSEAGTVWVAIPGASGFAVEQWRISDALRLREVRFEAAWWHVHSESDANVEAQARDVGNRTNALKPNSGVVALHDDGVTLWVVARHFGAAFEDVPPGAYRPDLMYDSFILAIDRDRGVVLAAEVVAEFAYGFTNRGNLVLYSENEDGLPKLQLKRVSFTTPAR